MLKKDFFESKAKKSELSEPLIMSESDSKGNSVNAPAPVKNILFTLLIFHR